MSELVWKPIPEADPAFLLSIIILRQNGFQRNSVIPSFDTPKSRILWPVNT